MPLLLALLGLLLLLAPAADAIKGDTPSSYRVRKKSGPPKWKGVENIPLDQGEIPVPVSPASPPPPPPLHLRRRRRRCCCVS